MPDLADAVAACGQWTAITIGDLTVFRCCSTGLRATVRSPLMAALIARIEQPGTCKRVPALRLLSGVSTGGDARTARFATSFLQSTAADIRHAAILTFASAASGLEEKELQDRASSCLCAALLDKDPRVCAAAAKLLPRFVIPEDPPTLAAASRGLRHATAVGRRSAITTLTEVAPRGDDVLIAKIAAAAENDAEWEVRAAACRSFPRLCERGNEVAHRALELCLKDTEWPVRHVAMGAITHISFKPSQHFISWAPDPHAGSSRKGGPAGCRSRQQRMFLESPASLTPPPAKRGRTSGQVPSVMSIAKPKVHAIRVRSD